MQFSYLSSIRNDLILAISNALKTIGPGDNDKPVDYFYTGVLGPHASTLRKSYTVPANKKARITGITLQMERTAAATTAGANFLSVGLYTVAGPYTLLGRMGSYDNAVFKHKIMPVAGIIYAQAGDKIETYTFDGSTGGLIQYQVNLAIEESDA